MILEDDLQKIKEKREVMTINYQDARMKKFASFTVETKLRQASEYIDNLEKKLNATAKMNRTLTPSISRLNQSSYSQPPSSTLLPFSTPNYERASNNFTSPSLSNPNQQSINSLIALVGNLTEEIKKMNDRITNLEKCVLDIKNQE
jgi:TolA-binding protein